MRRIAIAPADRFRRLVVVPDVATNLAREVRDGREDAAGEEVAFDLRKPEFDLVEPRGIGRGEVEMHVGMSSRNVRTAWVLWVDRLSAIT